MFKKAKRIVSLLVAALLVASSLTVGFSAFAAEPTTFDVKGTEAIVKGDAQIGTATHYDHKWNPQKNWEELKALNAEGTEKLSHKLAESYIYTNNGDNTYTATSNTTDNSMRKLLTVNGLGSDPENPTYKIENGQMFQVEKKDVFACSNNLTHAEGCDGSCEKKNIIVKQYGQDKDGFYYYDYFNVDGNGTAAEFGAAAGMGVKIRDTERTATYQFEGYTYEFSKGTTLKEVVFATTNNNDLRASYYEIYATTGKKADLYNAENLVAVYDGVEGQANNAFATHFVLNEAVEATFVGLKLIDPVSKSHLATPHEYFTCARIWTLDFYGTQGVEKFPAKIGNLNSALYQTALSEDNYSIPAKIAETNANYQPSHIYYRNGVPGVGGTYNTTGGVLWDGSLSADGQFSGNKTDGDGVPYDNCYTEIFYDFGATYEVNEVIWATHNTEDLRATDVTFYAADNFEGLFEEENIIGYAEEAVPGYSIATKGIKVRYVGAKVGYMGHRPADGTYLRLGEFDVRGKYFAAGDKATVVEYKNPSEGFAAMQGKTSLVVDSPKLSSNKRGEYAEASSYSAVELMKFADGATGEIAGDKDLAMQHFDANGNYIYGSDVYSSISYDLGAVQEISDVMMVKHNNGYLQAGFYKVYVSEDETIDETDVVARVNTMTRAETCYNAVNIVKMPENTKGRYVEVRIYVPTKMLNDDQDATFIYFRLHELNIYGPKGYTNAATPNHRIKKDEYFALNQANISASLIAGKPFYSSENITALNFGNSSTYPIYAEDGVTLKNWFQSNDPDFLEASKSRTNPEYYYTDADLSGVYYTKAIYPCSGTTEHAADCPADDTCVGDVVYNDTYQTIVYKLDKKAEITEVDIFHSFNDTRLTSHYLISIANSEADLFKENATTFDVTKFDYASYDLIKFDEPVVGKFVGIKILNGVHHTINSNDYNFGRLTHISVLGEEIVCTEHKEVAVIGKPATCTEEGLSDGSECEICGEVITAQTVISALGHTEGEEVTENEVPAKCGVAGSCDKVVYCAVCEAEISRRTETIPALEHKGGEEVTENEVPAKCGVAGSCDKVVYCTVCEAEVSRKTETIPALEHEWTQGEVKPGELCGETYRIDVCTKCSEEKKVPVTPEGEHSPEEIPAVPATCTEGGFESGYKCSLCNKVLVAPAPVDALGHKEVTLAAKAPTCTATGLTAGKQCSVCNEVTVKQNVVAAKGHTIVTIPAKAATYTATGLTAGKKCSVCGIVTVAQKVVAKLPQTSLKKAKFTVKDKTYTGKALTQSFTVKLGSKTLKNKVDYTISYKNNKNIGKATVTIKGIGAYKDSVSKTFAINPKKVSSLKLKAGKKQLTVSWKKDSKVGGYEIVYATSKNFKSGKKTVKITKASTAKNVIKKLKSKKTYYVKVRSFKKVSGKTYYGAYTSVKSVKVK